MFQRGQIIEYVYTANGAEYYTGKHNYDYGIYVNKQLIPIGEMIVPDFGLKIVSLGGCQISLF